MWNVLQGLSVKDRFKEGMQEGNVEKHWDQSELNTSGERLAKISLVSNQMSKLSLFLIVRVLKPRSCAPVYLKMSSLSSSQRYHNF